MQFHSAPNFHVMDRVDILHQHTAASLETILDSQNQTLLMPHAIVPNPDT